MLYALLGHAVSTAASVEDARRIVEGFADEFGLLATAEVLAYKVALASIDPAKLIEASQSVRAEVIESCRHDLVSDLRGEEPDALTNLHFGRYLDEALIGELSVFAKKLIADGEAKAYELAGHFVTLRPAERDGMPAERTHYLDSFEVLVPQDMWSLDEIPEYDENDVVPGGRLLGESNPICSSRHETHAQWWTIAHHKSLAAIELGHRNACDTRTPTHLATQFFGPSTGHRLTPQIGPASAH